MYIMFAKYVSLSIIYTDIPILLWVYFKKISLLCRISIDDNDHFVFSAGLVMSFIIILSKNITYSNSTVVCFITAKFYLEFSIL